MSGSSLMVIMSSRVDQLVAKLQLLGLRIGEARAYLAVVRLGSCRVLDISREAGLQRPEVYNIMGQLHSLGLVEETLDRPVRYSASAIQESIGVLTDALLRNDKEIVSDAKDLVGQLEKIRRKEETSSEDQVRIITGLTNIRNNFRDALSSAEKDLWFVAPRSPGSKSDIKFMLEEVAARRIRARAILDINQYNVPQVKRLASQVEVRHYQPLAVHMFGIDNKLVAVGLESGAQAEPEKLSELVTNYPSYVQTICASFESLWDRAVPLESRVAMIRGHDYHSEQMRIVWGRKAIWQVVFDWHKTSKKGIIEVTTRNGPIRLSQRYERKIPNGRLPGPKWRLLCYMSPDTSAAIRKLSRVADVRLVDRPFGIGIAIRDDSEALLHYIDPDSTDLRDSPHDLALVTEDPQIARNMLRMLEFVWKNAKPYGKKRERLASH
jgi:sugar-specific transcriptional regulator TrmB